VSDQSPPRPPLPIRAIGRGLSALVARAPFLWPVLRRPTQRFWDKMADRWDAGRVSAQRAAPLAAACDRLDPEPRRILELGTGTGTGALMLAGRFPDAEVWAVDLSEAMIRQARLKAPEETRPSLHFDVADAAALPHEAASFDLVCQLNLPLYADEIARVLAPGGYVVIASTLGSRTPYYTPDRVLRRRFERLGLEVLDGGQAGAGTYFLARRPGTGPQ
jgi:ubiquinone/menaquinone biosynthesis C-methylase UbiE